MVGGHVACMREMRNTYKILVVEPKGMRPLGRPRSRWKDKIRMDLREVGWEGVDQWQAVVNTVMNLRVP